MTNVSGTRFNLTISKIFVCLYFAFIAGCAGVAIKDDLPPSSPKGYADFANHTPGHQIIYSIQDGREVKEGSLTYRGDKLRLARKPGEYGFIIEHRDGSGRKNTEVVNIRITRDSMTFVTIDANIVEVEDVQIGRDEAVFVTYQLRISVAKNPVPVNFDIEPNKTDILNNLLKDPDWRVRLSGVGFLEKLQTSIDDELLRRVADLATDDPHKTVRKKASQFVKGRGIDVFKNVVLLENFELNNRRWKSASGRYNFFHNDQFLLGAEKNACENRVIKEFLDLPQAFNVELVSTWKSGIAGHEYGLLLGSDEKNFAHFGISGDGQAVVRSMRDNDSSADLIAWTNVAAIKKHGTAPNRLRLEARGDTWKYFVNDAYIGAVTKLKMTKYMLGLRVCQEQEIAFEQLKISRVPKK